MKKILPLLFVTLLVGLPVQAQRATTTNNNPAGNNPLPQYNLLEPLPCIPSPAMKDSTGKVVPGSEVVCNKPGEPQSTLNFKYYVQYMFNLLIALAAVAAVFMIVYGGLKYMSTDSWNGKKEGLDKVKNAVLGLILVLTSYLILRVIDPRLVEIPTTLVPALNIRYEKADKEFFSRLSAESARFNQGVAEARQQISDLEKANVEKQNKIYDLEEEREAFRVNGFSENDPEIQAINAQINSLIGEINENKTGGRLIIAKQDIDSDVFSISPAQGATGPVWRALGDSGPNWPALQAEIDRTYALRLKELQTSGASPAQIQELTKYKDYSKRVVSINQLEAEVIEIPKSTLSSSQVALRLQLQQKYAITEIDKIVSAASASTVGSNAVDISLYSKLVKRASEAKASITNTKVSQ